MSPDETIRAAARFLRGGMAPDVFVGALAENHEALVALSSACSAQIEVNIAPGGVAWVAPDPAVMCHKCGEWPKGVAPPQVPGDARCCCPECFAKTTAGKLFAGGAVNARGGCPDCPLLLMRVRP